MMKLELFYRMATYMLALSDLVLRVESKVVEVVVELLLHKTEKKNIKFLLFFIP